jgi:hypothetical protein
MKEESIIKTCITPHFKLEIDTEDGAPPKVWKLCLDYRALAKIELITGKDLKRIDGWKDISSGKDFPAIVWCCLLRFQPDITQDEVLEILNPASQRALSDILFDQAFPGVKEAYDKSLKEPSPNGQTGTTTLSVPQTTG